MNKYNDGTFERISKAEARKIFESCSAGKINQMFWDTEAEEIISLNQLKQEFKELKKDGNTEAKNFKEYLNNCLHKNGTLEPYENQDFTEAEE